MEKLFKAVLSKNAIQWILDYGQPIASDEFIGYVFPATNKMNGVCDLSGRWGFFSTQYDKKGNQKPLKEKYLIKYCKKLLKEGFLIFQKETPFPEFEYYTNLPINMEKIKYFNGNLFDME